MEDRGITGITRIGMIVIKEIIEVVVAEEEVVDMMETAVIIEEEIVAIVAGVVEAAAIGDKMRELKQANARKLKEQLHRQQQQQHSSRIRSCFLRRTKLTS